MPAHGAAGGAGDRDVKRGGRRSGRVAEDAKSSLEKLDLIIRSDEAERCVGEEAHRRTIEADEEAPGVSEAVAMGGKTKAKQQKKKKGESREGEVGGDGKRGREEEGEPALLPKDYRSRRWREGEAWEVLERRESFFL